ncbi:NAD-dependent epimerase/dehydratase family protein [Rathayibacter sp. Leaf248]|uniref:NAD-dependent epimerase/dehydratase family protein n=1 Tax=Rathayibacter sp. Leaf248 TaxID=2876555 RepID=UPI001E5128D6|nr:NAD(P)-dependent oxidoreductase [Rathayibacter sp. Leaf248]
MTRRTTARRRVFLTGAAGNWGRRVLDAFRERADDFEVVALVLPTPKDLAVIRRYEDMENLEVVFGDMTDYPAVERCVRGADVVLHIGAVVSPFADDHPELAHRINVGSIRTIIRAVRAQADPSSIAVVGVGTVAQTGDRTPPHHWGRVGDPLRVSHYDEYGQSKVIAEKELVDSGLPKWVQLRQTGILHPGMLEIRDPIMTHSTLGGVMEWVSAEDAARLAIAVSERDVPDELWGGIHNIGGGDAWRLTNWDMQLRISRALGVRDVRGWYERDWFATRNFHGHWYTDSDRLHELVPFRQDTPEDALRRAVAANPALRVAGRLPAGLVKNLVMKPLTLRHRGTMDYVRRGDLEAVAAYFGSPADREAIGGWDTFWPPRPGRVPTLLDHGYDESLPTAEWDGPLLGEVARHRGGRLLTDVVVTGDVTTALSWECAFGHRFAGSPRLILRAGHWCPECVRDVAGYPAQAERSPFLAQLEPAPITA